MHRWALTLAFVPLKLCDSKHVKKTVDAFHPLCFPSFYFSSAELEHLSPSLAPTDGPWDGISLQKDDGQQHVEPELCLDYRLLSLNITYLVSSESTSASLQLLSVISTCFTQLNPHWSPVRCRRWWGWEENATCVCREKRTEEINEPEEKLENEMDGNQRSQNDKRPFLQASSASFKKREH